MDKITTISDVSKALGIPASTLRYWDKQGLLRFERGANNYREFSFETMLDICNVMLLRDLEVPLAVLKQRQAMTLADLDTMFKQTKDHLEATMQELQQVITRINTRQQTLQKLVSLKAQKPTVITQQLLPIQTFNFTNKASVQQYLADPTKSADILAVHGDNSYTCGIFTPIVTTTELRAGDVVPKQYLHGVTWHNKTQAPQIDDLLAQSGLTLSQIGTVIFQYLMSINEDGQYRDYFEVWLELK
ncbi:MerR family transcriptional regulator [Periweissella ghanensis]|uniref:HTH merR-type domain-containing protein n=1 Tax=Periweissella ghanensis TaxID=467997 RepID=A0ABN8BMH9_9LACO|nr:MerR family transcriptional regulator [Periweissella ghanensis]MCM0600958.1 MerR family transcriptional regulator [Periweissella ghanensis]CAH0417624.1 hypothetical protein WGH24286_00036 [Periweissella ghanensis]